MSLSSPSFLHRPSQKHILPVFYLLPHSSTFCSTAVNICGTVPFNTSFLSRPLFRTFTSSFYSRSLISSYSDSLDVFPVRFHKEKALFFFFRVPYSKSHPAVIRAEQDINLLLQLGMFKETFACLKQPDFFSQLDSFLHFS